MYRQFSIYLSACILMLALGCQKEAALHPPLLPDAYQLPQGNQPYDDSIVAFKQQYGTYILYKFKDRDFAATVISRIADTAVQGDAAYAGAALAFFKEECLAWYPEAFRKKTLPFRIILAALIGTPKPGGIIEPSATGFSFSSEMLGIGWANEKLGTLTASERKLAIARMHRAYISRAGRGNSITIPAEFMALVPNDFSSMSEANKYERGMLEVQYEGDKKDFVKDYGSYVEAITSQTTAQLEAGILKSTVDKKGLIRKKYNIVVNQFKNEFKIDLTAIGNK